MLWIATSTEHRFTPCLPPFHLRFLLALSPVFTYIPLVYPLHFLVLFSYLWLVTYIELPVVSSLSSLFPYLLNPHPCLSLWQHHRSSDSLWYYGKSENVLRRLTAATFDLLSSGSTDIEKHAAVAPCTVMHWSMCTWQMKWMQTTLHHDSLVQCVFIIESQQVCWRTTRPSSSSQATIHASYMWERVNTYYDHVADMPSAELRVGGVLHVDHPAGYQDAQPC